SNGKLLDVSDQVFWSIDNTAIATITQLGLANGISPGKVTISATLNTANGDISNTATLRVLEPRVTIEEIQVKPYRTQLLIDGKQQYKATALLSNGDTPDVTNIVSWTIDDTSIAHITTKGEATAVSEGKAIVTASLRYQDALAQGSAELFVKAPEITVDTLFVTPLSETVFISDTIQYKAEALLSDGNRVTVTDQVNWRSSDESKAFISNTGLVNA
ncbi:MAG: hypothetical protein GY918_14545, partial [Gammaproteobacteria bacterium]|nr:hypothetical protein [Gammaproteobacteria bacterium]